jgi:hypothetical protein
VCPNRLEKEIFDLWATNLVLALISRLDPENKSKVNCLVGDLAMENGKLMTKSCLIDTTRVRAEVSGVIDFKNRHVDLEIVPSAKRPQLLSLNTPVEVHGKFSDFGPQITAEGVFRTVAGVGVRTVLFPLELLLSDPPPADGSDICPCKN